jgi:hypothetical protein
MGSGDNGGWNQTPLHKVISAVLIAVIVGELVTIINNTPPNPNCQIPQCSGCMLFP